MEDTLIASILARTKQMLAFQHDNSNDIDLYNAKVTVIYKSYFNSSFASVKLISTEKIFIVPVFSV